MIRIWSGIFFSLLGMFAVGSGLFDAPLAYSFFLPIFAAMIILLGLFAAFSASCDTAQSIIDQISGPLLWTVSGWILFRSTVVMTTHSFLLPAGTIISFGSKIISKIESSCIDEIHFTSWSLAIVCI